MPKTKNSPTKEQLRKRLARAYRDAQRATNKILGLDEEGDPYAKVVIQDYRLQEPFHFTPLPKHSALSIDDAELTEQRFTDIIRLAHCNLGCATEQLKRVADNFERWLERRRKRNALVEAFDGEFKMPVALDQLGAELHEGSTRIFELTFQQWDSASTFNPTTWAKEAHKKMLQLSREMPRRFLRVVLHLENGLRVYGIYERELADLTEAVAVCQGLITRWKDELKAENLSRRKFGRFSAFKSKTEFIRRNKSAIRRNEEKIRKLEAISRRLRSRSKTQRQ
jgi:hypothetical protein